MLIQSSDMLNIRTNVPFKNIAKKTVVVTKKPKDPMSNFFIAEPTRKATQKRKKVMQEINKTIEVIAEQIDKRTQAAAEASKHIHLNV